MTKNKIFGRKLISFSNSDKLQAVFEIACPKGGFAVYSIEVFYV